MNRKKFPPNNKSAGQMNESKVVASFLLVSHQKFAKSIHKGVSDFNDPAAGIEIRICFQFFFLITSGSNVCFVSPFFHQFFTACISRIKTQIMRISFSRGGTVNCNIIQYVFQ